MWPPPNAMRMLKKKGKGKKEVGEQRQRSVFHSSLVVSPSILFRKQMSMRLLALCVVVFCAVAVQAHLPVRYPDEKLPRGK